MDRLATSPKLPTRKSQRQQQAFVAAPSCRPDHAVLLSNSGNESRCLVFVAFEGMEAVDLCGAGSAESPLMALNSLYGDKVLVFSYSGPHRPLLSS